MKSKEYEYENGEDSLYFNKGVLECYAYCYYIDSCGNLELSKEETRKLYDAMHEYYKDK